MTILSFWFYRGGHFGLAGMSWAAAVAGEARLAGASLGIESREAWTTESEVLMEDFASRNWRVGIRGACEDSGFARQIELVRVHDGRDISGPFSWQDCTGYLLR